MTTKLEIPEWIPKEFHSSYGDYFDHIRGGQTDDSIRDIKNLFASAATSEDQKALLRILKTWQWPTLREIKNGKKTPPIEQIKEIFSPQSTYSSDWGAAVIDNFFSQIPNDVIDNFVSTPAPTDAQELTNYTLHYTLKTKLVVRCIKYQNRLPPVEYNYAEEEPWNANISRTEIASMSDSQLSLWDDYLAKMLTESAAKRPANQALDFLSAAIPGSSIPDDEADEYTTNVRLGKFKKTFNAVLDLKSPLLVGFFLGNDRKNLELTDQELDKILDLGTGTGMDFSAENGENGGREFYAALDLIRSLSKNVFISKQHLEKIYERVKAEKFKANGSFNFDDNKSHPEFAESRNAVLSELLVRKDTPDQIKKDILKSPHFLADASSYYWDSFIKNNSNEIINHGITSVYSHFGRDIEDPEVQDLATKIDGQIFRIPEIREKLSKETLNFIFDNAYLPSKGKLITASTLLGCKNIDSNLCNKLWDFVSNSEKTNFHDAVRLFVRSKNTTPDVVSKIIDHPLFIDPSNYDRYPPVALQPQHYRQILDKAKNNDAIDGDSVRYFIFNNANNPDVIRDAFLDEKELSLKKQSEKLNQELKENPGSSADTLRRIKSRSVYYEPLLKNQFTPTSVIDDLYDLFPHDQNIVSHSNISANKLKEIVKNKTPNAHVAIEMLSHADPSAYRYDNPSQPTQTSGASEGRFESQKIKLDPQFGPTHGTLFVKPHLAKLRVFRDKILELNPTGGEVMPKVLGPGPFNGGWKPVQEKNGNVSVKKIQELIDKDNGLRYHYTHSVWGTLQNHRGDNATNQRVFKLNLDTDILNQLKQNGVYNDFLKLSQVSNQSGHPGEVGHTIGWVRYEHHQGDEQQPDDDASSHDVVNSHPGNIYIDEIQTDFGKNTIKKLKTMLESPDGIPHGSRYENVNPNNLDKVYDILFRGHQPSEILLESFRQYHRNQGRENIKIHMPDTKLKLSQVGSEEQVAPAHLQFTYHQLPEKLGFKTGGYGETPEQDNNESVGQPTWKDKVRKNENEYYDKIDLPLKEFVDKKIPEFLNDVGNKSAPEIFTTISNFASIISNTMDSSGRYTNGSHTDNLNKIWNQIPDHILAEKLQEGLNGGPEGSPSTAFLFWGIDIDFAKKPLTRKKVFSNVSNVAYINEKVNHSGLKLTADEESTLIDQAQTQGVQMYYAPYQYLVSLPLRPDSFAKLIRIPEIVNNLDTMTALAQNKNAPSDILADAIKTSTIFPDPKFRSIIEDRGRVPQEALFEKFFDSIGPTGSDSFDEQYKTGILGDMLSRFNDLSPEFLGNIFDKSVAKLPSDLKNFEIENGYYLRLISNKNFPSDRLLHIYNKIQEDRNSVLSEPNAPFYRQLLPFVISKDDLPPELISQIVSNESFKTIKKTRSSFNAEHVAILTSRAEAGDFATATDASSILLSKYDVAEFLVDLVSNNIWNGLGSKIEDPNAIRSVYRYENQTESLSVRDTSFWENPNTPPDVLTEDLKKKLKSNLREGHLWDKVLSHPNLPHEELEAAIKSHDWIQKNPDLYNKFVDSVAASNPDDYLEKIVNDDSKRYGALFIETHPDYGDVNVNPNLAKLRVFRDKILELNPSGGEVAPKALGQGPFNNSWKPVQEKNGNVSVKKIQELINNSVGTRYNFSHGYWDGVQVHNSKGNLVFQLNLSTEKVKELKRHGVYGDFLKLSSHSAESHPTINKHTIGWIRYQNHLKAFDNNNDYVALHQHNERFNEYPLSQLLRHTKPDAYYLEELQTDFGDNTIAAFRKNPHRAKIYGINPDNLEKVKKILFGDHHPSEVLLEAFREHKRDLGHWDVPIRLPGEEIKAKQTGMDRSQALPAHMQFSYSQLPKKLWFGHARYGETAHENGPFEGSLVWRDTIRKTEELLNKALSDIKVGKETVNYPVHKQKALPPQLLGVVHIYDYNHLLSPVLKRNGYQLYVQHHPDIGIQASVFYKKSPIGAVGSKFNLYNNSILRIDAASIGNSQDTQHRGKGLGSAMYEALLAHAKNFAKVKKITGSVHSSMAHSVHMKLASKHGLMYNSTPNYEDWITRHDWVKTPNGPYDDKWGKYDYEI